MHMTMISLEIEEEKVYIYIYIYKFPSIIWILIHNTLYDYNTCYS